MGPLHRKPTKPKKQKERSLRHRISSHPYERCMDTHTDNQTYLSCTTSDEDAPPHDERPHFTERVRFIIDTFVDSC